MSFQYPLHLHDGGLEPVVLEAGLAVLRREAERLPEGVAVHLAVIGWAGHADDEVRVADLVERHDDERQRALRRHGRARG